MYPIQGNNEPVTGHIFSFFLDPILMHSFPSSVFTFKRNNNMYNTMLHGILCQILRSKKQRTSIKHNKVSSNRFLPFRKAIITERRRCWHRWGLSEFVSWLSFLYWVSSNKFLLPTGIPFLESHRSSIHPLSGSFHAYSFFSSSDYENLDRSTWLKMTGYTCTSTEQVPHGPLCFFLIITTRSVAHDGWFPFDFLISFW